MRRLFITSIRPAPSSMRHTVTSPNRDWCRSETSHDSNVKAGGHFKMPPTVRMHVAAGERSEAAPEGGSGGPPPEIFEI